MKVDELEYAASYALDHATEVATSSPDHGPRHWRDVARVAHLIAGPDADLTVLFLFAALHDTQRVDEFSDPDHGSRAAGLARHMQSLSVIYLNTRQTRQLQEALTHHDEGGLTDDPTIGTAWDADRLTIGRVGKIPQPRYFSTAEIRDDLFGYLRASSNIIYGADLRWSHIAALYETRMNDRNRAV